MAKHLRFDCMVAIIDCEEKRHPQIVMEELGISYQHSTPQSIAEQFWFWNCENVPESLPKFISIEDWDPIEMIGFGLSKKDAIKIRDYVKGGD